MPTVQVPAQLTVKHLMAAVEQLSSDELHEFMQRFTTWRTQRREQGDVEAALLACIVENSRLPAAEQ